MKKVIVSGANGYLAKNMIKLLIEKGVCVYAITRKIYNKIEGVHYIELSDVEKELLLYEESYDVFYHFAWGGSAGSERSNYKLQLENVENTINMALLSKKINCKKFIGIGTVTEKAAEQALINGYSTDNIVYGLTKKYTHDLLDIICRRENIDYIWTKLAGVYGKEDSTGNIISYTISCLNNNVMPIYGSGEQPYNFTYIDDVIEALFIIGRECCKKKEYVITNGESYLLKEYLEQIGDLYQKEIGLGYKENDDVIYEKSWFSNEDFINEFNYKFKYNFYSGLETYKSEYERKQTN